MKTGKDIRELHEKSLIFEDIDRTPFNNRPLNSAGKTREIKTFQDSNIFGLSINSHFINDFI